MCGYGDWVLVFFDFLCILVQSGGDFAKLYQQSISVCRAAHHAYVPFCTEYVSSLNLLPCFGGMSSPCATDGPLAMLVVCIGGMYHSLPSCLRPSRSANDAIWVESYE